MRIRLPEKYINTIKGVHGDKAAEFLQNFNQLIAECEQRYNMYVQEPFDLSYNFVAPAIKKGGQEVVLKVVLSDHEFQAELEALLHMKGKGAVQVIDYDVEKGIMILERLQPGHTLAVLEDDKEATRIAAHVMKKLIVLAPSRSTLPTVVDREESLKRIYHKRNNGFYPIPKESMLEALNIFEYLNTSIEHQYMLHGDLHHFNILKKGDSWAVIDPKGLIGDREYEVVQFMLNKLPGQNLIEFTESRIDIFVDELKLDKERLLLRMYSHAVLATCWTIEDGNFSESFLGTVQIFKELCQKHLCKNVRNKLFLN